MNFTSKIQVFRNLTNNESHPVLGVDMPVSYFQRVARCTWRYVQQRQSAEHEVTSPLRPIVIFRKVSEVRSTGLSGCEIRTVRNTEISDKLLIGKRT